MASIKVPGVAVGVIKPLVRVFFVLFFMTFLERTVIAETKFEFLGNFYNQSGHGGKQVYDGSGNEQLTVFEPVLFLEEKINHNTTLFGNVLADLWTSASEAIFDTNTGASGRSVQQGSTPSEPLQHRIAFNLGVVQKIGSWTLTPRMGYSNEYDYHSINGGLKIDKNLAQDNVTVSLGYQVFADETHPFDILGAAFTNWQSKTTHSINASASQILSPSDLILLGYNFTYQSGYLSGTQNSETVANIPRINEYLPDHRDRNAITLRYVHELTDALALHGDYRFYFDNWGILAHSIEPSLYWGFNNDAALLKIFYRFYVQSAATYYKDSFATAETYMTSDSDLASFNSNEGGSTISYQWDFQGVLKAITLSATALYYHRSNNLNAEVVQLGVGGAF